MRQQGTIAAAEVESRTIAVTAPTLGCGATVTAANLALSSAIATASTMNSGKNSSCSSALISRDTAPAHNRSRGNSVNVMKLCAICSALPHVALPKSKSKEGGTPSTRAISTTWNCRSCSNCASTLLKVSGLNVRPDSKIAVPPEASPVWNFVQLSLSRFSTGS